MGEEKIKMKDIAQLAGVSRSAVSLALNGKKGVSKKTREKIFRVIQENNYKPLRKKNGGKNHKLSNVRFIIINKANKHGLVTDNFRALPFFNDLLNKILKNINNFGGKVQIESLDGDNLSKELSNIKSSDKIYPAVILGTDLTSEEVLEIDSAIPKAVFIDTYYPGISADFVTMDNYQGAYLAAKTILAKGYKRIGYIASEKVMSNFQERRRGFYAALKEMEVELDAKDFYVVSPTRMLPSMDNPLLSINDLPQAVFCENDYMAIRLIKELNQQKINVPKDIGVIGFDDIYEGKIITPELTTIHVPIEQIADQALHQLQSKVALDDWEPQKCLVSTRLIERSSL